MSRAAAVVLAAGGSRRLGEPKQLVRLGGETLLERAVRVVREAGLGPAIVVLGARAAEVMAQCDLRDAETVLAERWAEGMSEALRTGIGAAAGTAAAGAVVLTCDMPFVAAAHLRALVKHGGQARASAYGGRHGVPAYLPRTIFAQVMALQGDAGARTLLQDAQAVQLSEEDALDIDTPEDLGRARERFALAKRLPKGAR